MEAVSPVKIDGANYEAIDTGDGYFLFRDIPIMGPVKKGEKNAPEDIGKPWMGKAVEFAQREYTEGKYAIPVHKGHHKQIEFGDPEFLGFALPRRVGEAVIGGELLPAVFADLKIKATGFDRIRRGELPFNSVEVDWKTGTITSLSFLDSKPPYFHFALFTVGNVVVDSSAKFEMTTREIGDFQAMECMECKRKDGKIKELEGKMASYASKSPEHYRKDGKMSKQESEAPKSMTPAEKAPVEQPAEKSPEKDAAKMAQAAAEESNKIAQFDAMRAEIAELKAENAKFEQWKTEQEKAKKAESLKAKAMEALREYTVGPKAMEAISKFADNGDEASLDIFIASFTEGSTKLPKAKLDDVIGVPAIPSDDPALSKFAKESPERLEAASKFVAEYREMKKAGFAGTSTEDEYVALRMDDGFKTLFENEGGK